ncbi:FAD binding domain-containing protein [Chloroflexota bacterium]
MRVSNFEYLEPQTVQEACSLLVEHQGKAKVIAGGTDLLVMMKQRVCTPQYLVNIKQLRELDFIEYDETNGLRIGPLTTLRALAGHRLVQERFNALSQAAVSVASPNIRNLATIGGNLCLDAKCWYYNQSSLFRKGRVACFKRGGDCCYVIKGGKFCYALVAADTVAALIALGAEARIVSTAGERMVPVAEFFTGQGDTVNVVGPEEIVTEIHVPTPVPNTFSAFLKESFRASIEFGITNAAVAITFDTGDSVCKDAKIALTAVSSGIVNAQKAAAMLKGKKIDAQLATEVAGTAVSETSPVSSIWTSVYHRRRVIAALVERVTLQAVAEASR